ncbi:MAG: hypothetical protein CVT48_05990 [Thermoplasmata archaeon HGW-Thermoplasmata-1]|nr:MAG: hypothetical protein CVT48_05990 [Thermoplasmata archaeon HGW-Thermoplasmata-1]
MKNIWLLLILSMFLASAFAGCVGGDDTGDTGDTGDVDDTVDDANETEDEVVEMTAILTLYLHGDGEDYGVGAMTSTAGGGSHLPVSPEKYSGEEMFYGTGSGGIDGSPDNVHAIIWEYTQPITIKGEVNAYVWGGSPESATWAAALWGDGELLGYVDSADAGGALDSPSEVKFTFKKVAVSVSSLILTATSNDGALSCQIGGTAEPRLELEIPV